MILKLSLLRKTKTIGMKDVECALVLVFLDLSLPMALMLNL
jgi:hypothetical protein